MDFLGNIGLRLAGALITVGVLVAVYFFAIKPATDTANNAINQFSEPVKRAEQDVARAQQQLQQNANNGGQGSQASVNQLDRLQRCVHKAHHDVNRLQRCAQRFAPH
jgi:methyl-accepting chemotaxis protein